MILGFIFYPKTFLFVNISYLFYLSSFIGEESENQTYILSDEPTWIVDPIDGTCNFVHT